ncbi:hypothetical protein E3P89_03626 [Wallemia ichthyophaga]|uniref:Amino acid permease/ SLC12A domain-containing protein n=2 Tax=Wallemia ichthyophaga TaxID=245174 RepID=A0A4T0HJ22_WALIC|nr:Amino-acid permease inda1 [Wallemia ichthyophaga EXF-994]TIA75558.1 hypothetical protein E3P91_00329 [Wallemia ichthyophaga]EOR01732.1 Amino-acid permease inda1 [Wallemia ichthyophaga EXF-994]TIA83523.1 hypothetical protein E3P98_00701 [Wallemia ichthyophaga]TIB03053.1 hypothetical protein E3P95_00675 [Wallemia ichthyophaga]TIB03978.1 hypothetical protein E3P94_00807 [Wallemia ichthyophaga]
MLHDEEKIVGLSSANPKIDDKKETSFSTPDVSNAPETYDPSQESIWTRLGLSFNSFRSAPATTARVAVATDSGDIAQEEIEGAASDGVLQKNIPGRSLQMIAVGGSIGTGLFISTGGALANGGPVSMIIGWLIMSVTLFCVVNAIGELAILYPAEGGFYAMANRFIDENVGYAMGMLYALQWVVVLPLELTAIAQTIQYWDGNIFDIYTSNAVWISVFFVVVIVINIFGNKAYAEEEFWSAIIKVAVILLFIISGIVFNCGGGPDSGDYNNYLGGEYYHRPGLHNGIANGFKGVCSVFVAAGFSFAGSELVGIAVSEVKDPVKVMPSAIKAVIWRIFIIFFVSVIIIGLNVPYDDSRLMSSENPSATSPFVIMMSKASVNGLDHLINTIILLSCTSIALASVYGGSRTIQAMAQQRFLPRWCSKVDKAGRPLNAVFISLLFGPLAYLALASNGSTVLDWLIAVSALSTLFTWLSICVCHIRFRTAWYKQGHTKDEIPYQSASGILGSYFAGFVIILILIAQFYIGVFPIGEGSMNGMERASEFFQAYLALPVGLLFYGQSFFVKTSWPTRSKDIDLDTGRKVFLTADYLNAQRQARKNAPIHKRIWQILFN